MRSNNSRVRFEVWISKTPTVCFYFCCRSFLSIREEILDFTIRVSLLLPPLFSLPSSLSPLLSPLFPFFFLILFANDTKTAQVSQLNRCHGDFEFHDSSLSPSPSPLLSPLFSLPSYPFSFLFFSPTLRKQRHFFSISQNRWWVWVFLERTRILSGIQFTTYFIDFCVLETKWFVDSFLKVILNRQTCGQRSSRAAESKRRTLGNYFSERICYMFLISKCRGDWDLSLCTTSGLVFGEPMRSGDFRKKVCFDAF